MKTKEELFDLIKKSEGEKYTDSNDIIFTLEDNDDTLYARRDGLYAFCTKSSEIDNWYMGSSIGNFSNTDKTILFMRELSEEIGFDFNIDGQIVRIKKEEVVVEKEVPSNEQYRLGGMVEAYEKILINRGEVTIRK